MKGSITTQRIVDAFRWTHGGQHLAVAAVYAACYDLTLQLSFPQWMLTSGLRLACLLLLPMRFWPALVVGESLPLMEEALMCAPDFGIPWAVLQAIPMVALWAPLLRFMRQRWPVFDAEGGVRMGMILWATIGTSVITALATTLRLIVALRHSPGKWPDIVAGDYFSAYLLGAYLGALTLTPTILALRERFEAHQRTPLTMATVWRSPLLRDTLSWVLPAMAALTWVAWAVDEEAVRVTAKLALLCPVVALAWRHGWHGTAVGGMAASVALAVTAQGALDPATIRVQLLLAVMLSITLWLGARASRRSQPLTATAWRQR